MVSDPKMGIVTHITPIFIDSHDHDSKKKIIDGFRNYLNVEYKTRPIPMRFVLKDGVFKAKEER